MDRELGFQLSDAPARRHQLDALDGRQPGLESLVDVVLPPPAVHRLVADAEIPGDIAHAAASGDEVKDMLAELRR